MIKNGFLELLEAQMNEEDDLELMVEISEDCFGAFNDIFDTFSFAEQMDILFPCEVDEENMSILNGQKLNKEETLDVRE